MAEFRSLSGNPRPPTYADREQLAALRAAGVEDVYCEPYDAPDAFWNNVVHLTHELVLAPDYYDHWRQWQREFEFAHGADDLSRWNPADMYDQILRVGATFASWVTTSVRLSAVELLLDVRDLQYESAFADRLNERARWHRVGLRLEGNRFVPVTSELMHTEVVQPTLLLLSHPGLEGVDGLYRKAFDRALSGDPSGAITASSSAVQELLRLGVGVDGGNMLDLANRARRDGWIIAAVHQFAVKLDSLREESDAHAPGTDDFDVALLAIHLAGSLLLHLGRTGPYAR